MSKILNEVLLANRGYVANFTKGDLAMPPARQFAILTCMDARLDSFISNFLQIIGHQRMVRDSPHRLRYGDFHQRHHERFVGKQLKNL